MSKKRVYEFAKENNLKSKEILETAESIGIEFGSHMSSMEDSEITKIKDALNKKSKKPAVTKEQPKQEQKVEKQPQQTGNKNNSQKGSANNKNMNTNENKTNNNNTKRNQNSNQSSSNKKNKRNKKHNYRNNNRKQNLEAHNMRKPVDHQPNAPKIKEAPGKVVYSEGMTVADIAKKIHREPAEIIKKLFMMGVMANQNQSLDKDTIELILAEYGIEAEEKVIVDQADFEHYFKDAETEVANSEERPPVVTIMGHVDHGKTTLLDYLRDANVTSGEAGGITQHIGAYQVKSDDKTITFLDTPGHAAFTTMRSRGADVTDIVILVVAADDGVMPQTIEAINHAKAADVPIIVAVNKIDKPTANPDRVMQELTDHGLIPEAWGGETIFVNISAKFGQNVDELLEMVLLVSEVQELKANPNQIALGSVVEARLDAHKGPIATLLVQHGTLNIGDPIVVGNTHGRVRVMINDAGRRIKVAGPSTPVEITGLQESPSAGDRFVVFEDEKTARMVGEERATKAQEVRRNQTQKVTLDNLFDTLQEGELKKVNVIIKSDVQGSGEAIAGSLKKIEVEGVKVDIIHNAVGAITESDVTLASASNAIIIGFNVRPIPTAKMQAVDEKVDIRLHSVIYNAIDEIETAMTGLLDPEYEEEITGMVLVRETYEVSKVGTIAGAYVTDGYIKRDSGVRVIRDNVVIYEGQLASLRRFKDDVKEVRNGYECGLMIEKYDDIKVDDQIEAFHMVEIKRK